MIRGVPEEERPWPMMLALLFFIVLAIVVFRDLLATDRVLFTTDDNIGILARSKSALPDKFFGGWLSSPLLGKPQIAPLNWTNLLLWLLPVHFFVNWIHAVDLALGSFFLSLFFRSRGLGWPAAVLGAVTTFWLGMNFTLTYSGHIGKFGVLLFAGLTLWLQDKAVRKLSVAFAIAAGGAWGGMLLEQPDVALLFLLALGPYALYRLAREHGWQWRAWVRVLIPSLLVSGCMVLMPSSLGYQLLIQSATVSGNRNAEEAWDFATQWSWPPEESIDFVAPGYMGWRSHELQGPYWGRMGRSPNWDSTGQGFRNFKLENQYLGAVPMVFALSSCWLLLWQRRKLGTSGHEVLFWAIVSVLSLVLSFGKHFYLYQLFYSLPLVSEIRNPNKFLQVFQLATGILSAYGLHFACRTAWIGKDRTAAVLPWRKFLFFLIGVGSASAALAVGAYQSRVRASEIVADLKATGWDAGAETIVHNRISALTHGAWMTFAALILL